MKTLLKMLIVLILILVTLYIAILSLAYNFQEKIIFLPDILQQEYKYQFDSPFEERFIETSDNIKLNALLFKADTSKGVVFFLHGNAGALNSWGFISEIYTEMNYDIFLYDYRGYGKSEGTIISEKQFYDDAQTAYNSIKTEYAEEKIVIIGQSIGSATAAWLAANNNPKKLILLTAYYSLTDLMHEKYKIIPDFLLKYKFKTNEYITNLKIPVAIIHGSEDDLISPNAAIRLKKQCKDTDELIIIEGMSHNGIHDNHQFQKQMRELLK